MQRLAECFYTIRFNLLLSALYTIGHSLLYFFIFVFKNLHCSTFLWIFNKPRFMFRIKLDGYNSIVVLCRYISDIFKRMCVMVSIHYYSNLGYWIWNGEFQYLYIKIWYGKGLKYVEFSTFVEVEKIYFLSLLEQIGCFSLLTPKINPE